MGSKITVKDSGEQRRILAELSKFKGATIRVGIFGPKAEFRPGNSKLSVVEYATISEFGSRDGHVPMRSFMRSTFDARYNEMLEIKRKALTRVAKGSLSAEQALKIIGQWQQSAVQKTITDLREPPNAPSTIAKKGSSNPLIDSGHMRAAVTYSISMAGGVNTWESEHQANRGDEAARD